MYRLQRVCRLGEQKLKKNLSNHFYVFFFFYSQMTENNLRGFFQQNLYSYVHFYAGSV